MGKNICLSCLKFNLSLAPGQVIYFTPDYNQARTQGGCPGCPGNHLFVLKYLIWLNENIILFDISFIKGLVKGRLTNENNKRTIADAEILDNRNGPQVGYDQALYPRPHDIFDYLCFLS